MYRLLLGILIWLIGATTIMIIANENGIKKNTMIHQSANDMPTSYIDNKQEENNNIIQEQVDVEEAEEQTQTLDIKRYDISISNREDETEIQRFKRLYPSSITTQESIGCDNYLPNFSEEEKKLYNQLFSYYDAISDRRLVDIWSMQNEENNEKIWKITDYIQRIESEKERLENYINQPEKYYIRKNKQQWEYTHYNEKISDRYNIEIYDITKTIKPISDKMLQALANRRWESQPYTMRAEWFYQNNTYLYDMEAIQRYVGTFNATCWYYDAYDGHRERKINKDEIIKDRQEYSEGDVDQLVAKPSRWNKKEIKIIEELENGIIGFVYWMWSLSREKNEWYHMWNIGTTILLVGSDWIQTQTSNQDLSLIIASPEDPQDLHWWLLWPKKEDGSREKVKYIPACHTYIEQNRKSVFDENSRKECNRLIEEFVQNFLDWVEQSQELERLVKLTKDQIRN